MKNAILFFIILATLCCNTEIYSQTSPVDDFSKFSKQDIPLKGDDTDFDEGIARTPARQSAATAFLYGNCVYFNFACPVNDVKIAIIDKSTGKYIYAENHNQPDIIIDINTKNKGEYQIMINSIYFFLWGEFSIDQ